MLKSSSNQRGKMQTNTDSHRNPRSLDSWNLLNNLHVAIAIYFISSLTVNKIAHIKSWFSNEKYFFSNYYTFTDADAFF